MLQSVSVSILPPGPPSLLFDGSNMNLVEVYRVSHGV